MPTIFTHGAVGFTAAKSIFGAAPDRPFLAAAVLLPMLPDVDGLFRAWVPYGSLFGHRGITHSLPVAAAAGVIAAALAVRQDWAPGHSFLRLALFFALITASHGFFDALTDGGMGVAFFAPFDSTRYFLPWRPIPVSPMSASGLMTPRGLRVVRWEFMLFWLFAISSALWRRRSPTRLPRLPRLIAAATLLTAGTIAWLRALSG